VKECEDLSGAKGRGASPAGVCGGRKTARSCGSGKFGWILSVFLLHLKRVVIDLHSTNALQQR
jgi:hypothetical protein